MLDAVLSHLVLPEGCRDCMAVDTAHLKERECDSTGAVKFFVEDVYLKSDVGIVHVVLLKVSPSEVKQKKTRTAATCPVKSVTA
jgi:hypothetical protein